jgi:PAP2 superfamily protein
MDSVGEGTQSCGPGGPDRRSRPHRLALIVVFALAFPALAAEEPAPRKVLDDVREVVTAPIHWRAHEWTRFGEGVALVLAAHAADDRLLRDVQRLGHDSFFHDVTPFGGGRGTQVTFVLIGAGWLWRDQRMLNTGVDALESSVFSEFITQAGKKIARRERPNHSDNQSFPSGHATNAFAIATAIATNYHDKPAVPVIAYALATSVALARVHDNVHFPSDVVAGALIGRAVAKSITARHAHVTIIPVRRGFVGHIVF